MELTHYSARGDNFFTCLPTEILENEILSRLSPPGVAALILAIGLQVPFARRQPIYILWKHLREGSRRQKTLTAKSRDPCDEPVIADILGERFYADNPSDHIYLRMELGVPHGTDRLTSAADFVMVQEMISRGQLRGKIDTRWFSEDYKYHAMLMMGQVPNNLAFLRHILGARYVLKGVDEKTLLEFILQEGQQTRSDADIDLYLSEYFRCSPGSKTSICSKLLERGVECPMLLNSGPTHVYKDAADSGYLWWSRDSIKYASLIPAKWKITVADFTPRLNGKTLRCRDLLACKSASMFSFMFSGIVTLFGAQTALNSARQYVNMCGYVSMAHSAIEIFGKEYLAARAELSPWDMNLYVAAGGEYSQVSLNCVVHAAKYALRYGNNLFFRDLVADNEMSPSDQHEIIAECIRRGNMFGLCVILERGYEINPEKFRREICRCPNVDMIEALKLL
mgnify:CR=1 FL=1